MFRTRPSGQRGSRSRERSSVCTVRGVQYLALTGSCRAPFGLQLKAPIVIGRDHLDCGSVASPNRETEAMLDGTDAVSDWAILNFAVNTASGASWTSFHHGGGVGIGFSQHAGQVIVADGSDDAAARIERVLTNDPMMGVFRHADAGYELAKQCARQEAVKIPML